MYTYVHKIYMYMIYIYICICLYKYIYIYILLLISSKSCRVVTVFDCSPAPFTRLNKLKCEQKSGNVKTSTITLSNEYQAQSIF